MNTKYFTLITDVGKELIADAVLSDKRISISHFAVGDGGGILPRPSTSQTELGNEKFRAQPNRVIIDNKNPSQIIVEVIIPESVGGWWLREGALFNESGQMIAVANCPETYKPMLAEGSGRTQIMRMVLIVSNTAVIELKTDPDVVVATRNYVDEAVKAAMDVAIEAKALALARPTFDEIYPIGDTKFFASFLNPNKKWPDTVWYYLGENKTIRTGKADGSDVMKTGGSDSIMLTAENMPAHKHKVSGKTGGFDLGTKSTESFDHGSKNTSEFNHGTKNTSQNGGHSHQAGMSAPGESWDGSYIVGSDNDSRRTRNRTSNDGEHVHSVDIGSHGHAVNIGKHSHTMNIGVHSHSVDLNTEETGSGKPFSIVESHIILMGWYRAA